MTIRTLLGLAALGGLTAVLLPALPAHAVDDRTAPTVNVTMRAPDSNGWHRVAALSVSIFTADTGSGVDPFSSSVTLSGAQNETVPLDAGSNSVSVTADGVTTLSYEVSDIEGNVRRGQTVVRVDDTVPTATVDVPQFVLQGAAVTVQPQCADAHSGVSFCSPPRTLDTSVRRSLQDTYGAADMAGNEYLSSYGYRVVGQEDAPRATMTPRTTPTDQGWFSGPVVLDQAASSPYGGSVTRLDQVHNGVASSVDGSSAVVTVSGDGVHSVAVRATDAVGLVGDYAPRTVSIDSAAPTADLAPVGPVTVGATVVLDPMCQDQLSGVQVCDLDGDVVASGRLDTSTPGTKTVDVEAIDKAGNRAVDSTTVVVSPAPVVTPPPGTTGQSTTKAPTAATATYAVKKSGKATATVTVTGRETVPSGVVEVYDGKRLIGTAQLGADGTVKVRLKKLAKGKHVLTARYLGSDATLPCVTPKKKIRVP